MDLFLDTLYYVFKVTLILILIIAFILLCACRAAVTEPTEPVINEYEVMSVYQYTDTITNKFGGVIDTKVKYCFTYIGDDGQLHECKDFYHTEYGIWKLHIGKKNKYVTKGSEKHLYLTKETFKNLSKGD